MDLSLQSHRYVSHIVERDMAMLQQNTFIHLGDCNLVTVDSAIYRNHKEHRKRERWEGVLVGALPC
jgi:hypothetical protein